MMYQEFRLGDAQSGIVSRTTKHVAIIFLMCLVVLYNSYYKNKELLFSPSGDSVIIL